jgi:hypothetical protein
MSEEKEKEKEKDTDEELRDPVEEDEEQDLAEDEGEEEDLAEDEDDEEDEEDEGDEGEDLDLEERVLCVDGACIGVVGRDGKCKICGTPHPDGPPAASSPVSPASTEKAEQSPEGEPVANEDQAAADDDGEAGTGTEDPLDFSKRVLCSDGTCTGVIGKDGRCRTCGKPYTGEPED